MKTELDKMLAGLAHRPGDAQLKEMRFRNRDLLFQYNQLTHPSDRPEKLRLLKEILANADETTYINSPFLCDYGKLIQVGKNFFANYHCTILDSGTVKIGDDVMFAPNVSLYTVGHPLDPDLRRVGWEQAKPIVIGNNVWVGGNVVILAGVTIGDNCVIGAGSVVTKDIPANSLALGNPCLVLREITEQDRLMYQQQYLLD